MITNKKKAAKVGKMVDTTHVNTVLRNYKNERWIHNSERLGKEDSLSIWYSLEELQGFMTQAQESGADGIRLYFGVYDSQFADHPLHAGRQTVVLVATKEKETAAGTVTKDIYVQTGNGTSILAYNVGKPCPPFCNTGDDGYDISILDQNKDEAAVVA